MPPWPKRSAEPENAREAAGKREKEQEGGRRRKFKKKSLRDKYYNNFQTASLLEQAHSVHRGMPPHSAPHSPAPHFQKLKRGWLGCYWSYGDCESELPPASSETLALAAVSAMN